MAKGSFFSRFSFTFKDDEGPTSEDIDREVTEAVAAIQSADVSTVSADAVLHAGVGGKGPKDRVYLFDLGPLYKVIGDRNSRLSETLRLECDRVFQKRKISKGDVAGLERDLYLMRFPTANDMQGFARAAIIVNEIGKAILGDRFEAIDVDGLLVVATVEHLIDEHGNFDMSKASAVIASGGIAIETPEPPDNAPKWIRLRWHSEKKRVEMVESEHAKAMEKQKKDHVDRPPELWSKRSQRDRRKRSMPVSPQQDRRKSFDRRGRGYSK